MLLHYHNVGTFPLISQEMYPHYSSTGSCDIHTVFLCVMSYSNSACLSVMSHPYPGYLSWSMPAWFKKETFLMKQQEKQTTTHTNWIKKCFFTKNICLKICRLLAVHMYTCTGVCVRVRVLIVFLNLLWYTCAWLCVFLWESFAICFVLHYFSHTPTPST